MHNASVLVVDDERLIRGTRKEQPSHRARHPHEVLGVTPQPLEQAAVVWIDGMSLPSERKPLLGHEAGLVWLDGKTAT